jgi:hypothetical protein
MSKSLVAMCRGSALAAEVLAYGTVFAYLIIICTLSLSRHPGGYLFMTTLPPCCHYLDKGAAAVGLIKSMSPPSPAIVASVRCYLMVLWATYR